MPGEKPLVTRGIYERVWPNYVFQRTSTPSAWPPLNTALGALTSMPARPPKPLTGRQIQRQVFKRLERYDHLNLAEQYAMFMGKAQLLELYLKQLHARRSGTDIEDMERWTLGRTTTELKRGGLRGDFIALLESLVDYRNFMAHEFLLSELMLRALTGNSGRLVRKHLERGAYELEQVLLLHDWCEKHNAWA